MADDVGNDNNCEDHSDIDMISVLLIRLKLDKTEEIVLPLNE